MLMSHADTQIGLCIPIIGVSMLIVYMELFILPNPKFRRKFWIGWISIIIGTLCISILGKNQAFHVYYLLAIFMLIRYIEGRMIWYSISCLVVIMGIGIGTKIIWARFFCKLVRLYGRIWDCYCDYVRD